MKKILYFTLLIGFVFISCKSKTESQESKIQKEDQSGPEYTSAYICPMYCKGSGSDKPGLCPVCGMEYEKREN